MPVYIAYWAFPCIKKPPNLLKDWAVLEINSGEAKYRLYSLYIE